jgi:hypothetical protein
LLKKLILLAAIACYLPSKAQRIDSIFVHLYTDSLKKGTYNYINIDGRLSNGRYLPLDSNHLHFRSSAGIFFGNSLFLPQDFTGEKVNIHVELKNSTQTRDFILYVKKASDPASLPTEEDILRKRNKSSSSGRGKNR